MKYSRTVKYLITALYFLLTTLIICAPALNNGYPLLFSDTGTYIHSAFLLTPPSSRPIGYGLFINIFSLHATLWTVMFMQCLIINLLIYKVLKLIFPQVRLYFIHFAIIVVLILLSSLSWYSCQIMPDIFTSGIFLIIFILFSEKKIPVWEGILFSILFFFFIVSHFSHFPLAILILATIFIFHVLRVNYFVSGKVFYRRLVWLLLMIIGSSIIIMSHHAYYNKGFRLSLTSNVFLAGRLSETGILHDYLEEHCEQEPNILCDQLETLPTSAGGFLWTESSPMKKAGISWEEADSAFAEVIHGIYTTPEYLGRFVWESIKATFRQLFNVDIGSGLLAFRQNSAPYPPIDKYFGNESVEMLVTLQSWGKLDFKFLNIINYFVLSMSVIIIFWACYNNKLNKSLKAFIVITFFGILYNSAITASLANISDRLQARVTWVIVFIALIILIYIIKRVEALIKPHFIKPE